MLRSCCSMMWNSWLSYWWLLCFFLPLEVVRCHCKDEGAPFKHHRMLLCGAKQFVYVLWFMVLLGFIPMWCVGTSLICDSSLLRTPVTGRAALFVACEVPAGPEAGNGGKWLNPVPGLLCAPGKVRRGTGPCGSPTALGCTVGSSAWFCSGQFPALHPSFIHSVCRKHSLFLDHEMLIVSIYLYDCDA